MVLDNHLSTLFPILDPKAQNHKMFHLIWIFTILPSSFLITQYIFFFENLQTRRIRRFSSPPPSSPASLISVVIISTFIICVCLPQPQSLRRYSFLRCFYQRYFVGTTKLISPSAMMSSPRSFHLFAAAKSKYVISLFSNHSYVGFLLTNIVICLN